LYSLASAAPSVAWIKAAESLATAGGLGRIELILDVLDALNDILGP
jgi:hypothetical protein